MVYGAINCYLYFSKLHINDHLIELVSVSSSIVNYNSVEMDFMEIKYVQVYSTYLGVCEL